MMIDQKDNIVWSPLLGRFLPEAELIALIKRNFDRAFMDSK